MVNQRVARLIFEINDLSYQNGVVTLLVPAAIDALKAGQAVFEQHATAQTRVEIQPFEFVAGVGCKMGGQCLLVRR